MILRRIAWIFWGGVAFSVHPFLLEAAPVDSTTFTRLEARLRASVVSVYAVEASDGQDRRTYDVEDATFQSRIRGSGSGFFVDDGASIITNSHVLEGAASIFVQQAGSTRAFRAEVRADSPDFDLALLKAGAGLRGMPIEFGDSSVLKIGEWIAIFGSPLGMGHSMSVGIVGAKNRVFRSGRFENYIQLSAPVNPGNSGGPVVGLDGKLLGIVTLKAAGFAVEGIGMAIPVTMIRPILKQFLKKGRYQRPWFGFSVARDERAKDCRIRVEKVEPDSPAGKSGIREGDRICSMDGRKFESANEFSVALVEADLSDLTVLEMRDASGRTLKRQVRPVPEDQEYYDELAAVEKLHLGLELDDLSFSLKHRLGVESEVTGVHVRSVRQGSQAQKSGISVGDIITAVDGREVKSTESFVSTLAGLLKKESVMFSIMRSDGEETPGITKQEVRLKLRAASGKQGL